MASIRESFNKEQAHALLTANNFLCDEDLWDVIEYADNEAYDFIYNNRNSYCSMIQYLLEPKDFIPSKLRVLELTDADMVKIENDRKAAAIKEFDVLWDSTLKKDLPGRPRDDLDDDLDDAWDDLTQARNRMTAYLNKKNTKYVPPSARTKSDPAQEKIEKDIEDCKTAFNNIEKRISEADDKYIADKKDEFFRNWLYSV